MMVTLACWRRLAPVAAGALLIGLGCAQASAYAQSKPPALALAPPAGPANAVNKAISFSDEEQQRIALLGPWPTPAATDPSNRWSGNAQAIAFGRLLFHDKRLSANRSIACASCHQIERGLSDGRRRAIGLAAHDRNTQTLWNIGLQRWFGWDGGADSLWAASIRPILAAHEMGMTPQRVAAAVKHHGDLANPYRQLFGEAHKSIKSTKTNEPSEPRKAGKASEPSELADADRVLVNVAKSIAAYMETLISPRTSFDAFRDSLLAQSPAVNYPSNAQRGLKLFVGRGNCFVCHFGPAFSNGEFHDIGRPFIVAPGRVDPGRFAGIKRVQSDRFNLLSVHNDENTAPKSDALAAALKTQTVNPQHRNWGEWRTPSLRGLRGSAPYMHDGSLATLHEVVRHYSNIKEERLHSDGESILKPLRLTKTEIDDLVAFLLTLSASP